MKLIYIAGPYSGDIEGNVKRAKAAMKKLYRHGWAVHCPHLQPDMDYTLDEWLKIDFYIIDKCDAVFFLKNWRNSLGSCREYLHATRQGKTIYMEENGYPVLSE